MRTPNWSFFFFLLSFPPSLINLYRPKVIYIRRRLIPPVGWMSNIYDAAYLLTLRALTVRCWVWNQNKPTQVDVRGPFVSLKQWNLSSRYWFRNGDLILQSHEANITVSGVSRGNPSSSRAQLTVSQLEVKHSQHWPTKGKQRRRVCSLNKKTRITVYQCKKCDVELCVVGVAHTRQSVR
jgi:hypothetical protein